MGLRGIVVLAAALAGGAGLSQFPEFSQQYLQRLAGQVDALSVVVANFDATARRNGLTREAALAQLTGSAFLTDRQADLRNDFARHDRLSGDLALLRAASPLERLAMPHRLGDHATFAATWADYRPAVPVTTDGLVSAGVGAGIGWGAGAGLLALLAWPFRRRRNA